MPTFFDVQRRLGGGGVGKGVSLPMTTTKVWRASEPVWRPPVAEFVTAMPLGGFASPPVIGSRGHPPLAVAGATAEFGLPGVPPRWKKLSGLGTVASICGWLLVDFLQPAKKGKLHDDRIRRTV